MKFSLDPTKALSSLSMLINDLFKTRDKLINAMDDVGTRRIEMQLKSLYNLIQAGPVEISDRILTSDVTYKYKDLM